MHQALQHREVWMILKDRKMLARLMAIQGVSGRRLAAAAGWKSHTYMRKLISGEVRTLEPQAAVRIAEFLQVGTDDLFMARSSTHGGRPVQSQKRAS